MSALGTGRAWGAQLDASQRGMGDGHAGSLILGHWKDGLRVVSML